MTDRKNNQFDKTYNVENDLTKDIEDGFKHIYLEKQQRYMLKGDLHIHTEYSDGDILDEVLFKAVNSGLDFIAITDHDTVKGVPFAQEWVKRKTLPTIVIPGCEISGPGCHLLALGCNEELICSNSIGDIMNEVHRQGGVLCAAHPCWKRTFETFWKNRLFHDCVAEGKVDGIELINYAANYKEDGNVEYGNVPVLEYYKKLQKAGMDIPFTVGSDAHHAVEIGKVYIIAFPEACTSNSILKAIFKDRMAVACWKDEVYGPPAAVALYKKYCMLFDEREKFRKSIRCSLERQENKNDIIFRVTNDIPLTDYLPSKIYFDPRLELVKAEEDFSKYTIKRNSIASGRDSMFIRVDTDKYSLLRGVITNTESRVVIESKPRIKNGRIIYTVNITNKYSEPLDNTQLHLEINDRTIEFITHIDPGKNLEYNISDEDILLCGKENKLKILLLNKLKLPIDMQDLSFMIHVVNKVGTSFGDNEYLQLEQYVLKDKKRSDDVEAKVAFHYDDDELTVITIVKDDFFYQPYTGGIIYMGDSIQLGLDPQCSRSQFNLKARQTFEFQLALTSKGVEIFPDMLPPGVNVKPVLDVSVNGNLYTYTFKIKWKDLGIKPSRGTIIGFNIIVNINDGNGKRGWLQWTPGIADRKRAADWGWLILN